ncbi:MAG: OmpH family outer membrane protein [Planctomycetota bacterium]
MKKNLKWLVIYIATVTLISGIIFTGYVSSQETTNPAGPDRIGTEEDKQPEEPIETPVPQLKIGVVNLAEVFSKHKKKSELDALLQKEMQKEELKIKDLGEQIKKLIEELDGDVLAQNSPLRKEKQEESAALQARREHLIKNWNNWLRIKNNEHNIKLYKEISKVVNEYAEQNNYSLILKIDPPVGPENTTEEINFRNVLYYHQSLDITEEIIKISNK